ncbi:hypothetical protein RP20_CCG007895 [Aedes albopictus]|nr:hypothetical protein RP20_CCG007895 [Aedes albopictus]
MKSIDIASTTATSRQFLEQQSQMVAPSSTAPSIKQTTATNENGEREPPTDDDRPPTTTEPTRMTMDQTIVTVRILDSVADQYNVSNGATLDIDALKRDTEITLNPRSVNDTR